MKIPLPRRSSTRGTKPRLNLLSRIPVPSGKLPRVPLPHVPLPHVPVKRAVRRVRSMRPPHGRAVVGFSLAVAIAVLAIHWILDQYWQFSGSIESGLLWHMLGLTHRIPYWAIGVLVVVGLPLWAIDELLSRRYGVRSRSAKP